MSTLSKALTGTGLGLRDEHIDALAKSFPSAIDFLEVAPENWIKSSYKPMDLFEQFAQHVPIVTHGLSLSLGGPQELDWSFLDDIKQFLDQYHIDIYTEHLTYCSYNGHVYDLLPIPFTEEAVHYVSDRIRQVQDKLERRIAIENASYYCAPGQEMDEVDFVNAVLHEADCDLLLDVNNIYVNSVNHNYNAKQYIDRLTPTTIRYIHIAGHWKKEDNLIIDTHGEDIIDPVWNLLDSTYQRFGNLPTLLERDSDIPPLNECLLEIEKIKSIQARCKKVAWDYA